MALNPQEPVSKEHSEPDSFLSTRLVEAKRSAGWRDSLREQALANAMHKRATGVPTYSVQEAAALLSISQEYLYRLIQRGSFPAVRMRLSGKKGRYVVPAQAVERLLSEAALAATSVEIDEWAASYAPPGARAAREA